MKTRIIGFDYAMGTSLNDRHLFAGQNGAPVIYAENLHRASGPVLVRNQYVCPSIRSVYLWGWESRPHRFVGVAMAPRRE